MVKNVQLKLREKRLFSIVGYTLTCHISVMKKYDYYTIFKTKKSKFEPTFYNSKIT